MSGPSASSQERRALRTSDLFAIRWLSDVALSPDGSTVACVESRVDEAADGTRSRILLVDVATGAVTSPSPDDATDLAPRWSPDGARLAFVGGRGEARTAWSCGPDGREARPLSAGPARVAQPAWSPDGARLALTIHETAPGDPGAALWEVPGLDWHHDGQASSDRRSWSTIGAMGSDGLVVGLTGPGAHDRWPAWSPDGGTVAFLSDRGIEEPLGGRAALWLVPADPGLGGPRPLLPSSGPIAAFTWSPDGAAIAWLGHREGVRQGLASRLWITTVADGATRQVPVPGDPTLGLTVRSDDGRGMGDTVLRWTSDGRIWLRWAEGGRARLGWVDPLTGGLTPVVGGDRAVLAFDVPQRGGGSVAFVAATADEPGEISLVALDGTGERRLTRRNDWLDEVALGTTELVTATGPGDLPLEAWLILPPGGVGTAPLPVVVSVHGGPHYPVGWRFSFEHHRLAGRGYAVLAGNVRGSAGYGDAFATAIHGDWGGGDLADTHALIDGALTRPDLDPHRLAITGVSYGGYHAMWAVTQGDRFRAAIAENGISDLLSSYASGEDDGSFWPGQLGGEPWDVPAEYLDRSALRHADRIRTPLLIIHAELDQGCTIAQSEQLFTALRRLGRTTRLLRAPGLGHLMNLHGSARFRLARAAAVDDWLDRFLRA